MSDQDVGAEPGFDELVIKLRTLVEKLEQGNLPLEESLRTFEEGMQLATRGHELLDNAEMRIEKLSRGGGREPLEEDSNS